MSVHRPKLWTYCCKCACNQKVWETRFGDVYAGVFVSSRQQGDGGGVGTGLTVWVMCSDTQMAADTTQIDSHSVHSHSFSSYSLKWMFSHLFAFVSLASARLETHSNLCKKSYYHFFFSWCSFPLLYSLSSFLGPLFLSSSAHAAISPRCGWSIFGWYSGKKAGCHTWMILN